MSHPKPKLGYVLKVFPRLSETFILNELLELERQGFELDVFSLNPPGDSRFHGALGRLAAEITYLPRPDSSEMWNTVRTLSRELDLDATRSGAAFLAALHSSDSAGLKVLMQGLYIAGAARRRGIQHLHAHFATVATAAALTAHRLSAIRFSFTALTAHRLSGIRFSFTAHAKDIYHRDHDDTLLADALAGCAFAVTVTEFNRAQLERKYPSARGKVRRIYNGLPVGEWQAAAAAAPPVPHIISVGRLIEKKGFTYLLQACRMLKDRGRRFTCTIIGAGEKEQELRAMLQSLDLAPDVQLLGPQSQDTVLASIAASTMMVLPCIVGDDGNRDALPTVLLEAMALAKPVVSTDLEGVTEIVEDGVTGLLAPQRDAAALADRIDTLLQNSGLCESFGEAGRRRAERLFDLRRNGAELAALYEEAAGTALGVAAGSLVGDSAA